MPVLKALVLGMGVYDEARQLALDRQEWQDLRTRINHSAPVPLAFCLGCNEPAHVKAATSTTVNPHFSHFKGGGVRCPWGPDDGRTPDQVRAGIFDGNQESPIHREMCHRVLDLVMRDTRFEPGSGAVDSYLAPEHGGRGRWPDVRFELRGLGRFAVEVQFAPSLATEVVARSKYYLAEGIHLIWLVPWYSFEVVARAFTADIAQEAGGTLFVLDDEATAASLERNTLIFWAAWQSESGRKKKLICLDDLDLRPDRHPLLVDNTAAHIFGVAERRRHGVAEKMWESKGSWSGALVRPDTGQRDEAFDRLMRVLFSILAKADENFLAQDDGTWPNFLNNQKNLSGLLNAYLSSGDGEEHAVVVYDMLTRTKARSAVTAKVWEKIEFALLHPQLDITDPAISEAKSYFPEIFRSDLRGNPLRTEILPSWAT
ncbi:competence protein CoiA family protein [Tabrizicola fusiformis]|uniref:hypothetical protein n=1 Tax=Tabrizicola sp. SY72 TaxID=2741673 RepID=UPI00157262F4|nr:hypothetical protein [Tabrizicola sp. SY72]NTT88027.1 hypothetical protein [Tabrizicola sp. SY72]